MSRGKHYDRATSLLQAGRELLSVQEVSTGRVRGFRLTSAATAEQEYLLKAEAGRVSCSCGSHAVEGTCCHSEVLQLLLRRRMI